MIGFFIVVFIGYGSTNDRQLRIIVYQKQFKRWNKLVFPGEVEVELHKVYHYLFK